MSTVSLWRGADLPMSSCKRALLLLWLFLGGGALLLLLFRAVIAGAYGQASEDVWAWFLPNIIPTLSLMIGVVVNNAILLVEFANRRRAEGATPHDAALSAAQVRLRPILMTSLTLIASMIPLSLHLTPGNEAMIPLARALLGGMVISTLLTLVLVPCVYCLVHGRSPQPA